MNCNYSCAKVRSLLDSSEFSTASAEPLGLLLNTRSKKLQDEQMLIEVKRECTTRKEEKNNR
jgi:hypothetical protein